MVPSIVNSFVDYVLNHPVWKQTISGLFQNELKKVKWYMVKREMVHSKTKWFSQRRNNIVKNEMI